MTLNLNAYSEFQTAYTFCDTFSVSYHVQQAGFCKGTRSVAILQPNNLKLDFVLIFFVLAMPSVREPG